MAKPVEKVEIGFDLTGNNVGPYFRLDDSIAGALNNTSYVLGGTIFFDVTDQVKGFTIRRGKSRQLDRFSSGQATVVLDNNNRDFDPTYAASPYYGQIIPRRDIRITSGTVVQYFGSADDWNLDYSPNGDNLASVTCSDGFRTLANQTLAGGTQTVQRSGERIAAILDLTDVNWPASNRNIEAGGQTLGADVIAPDTNALTYLQLVETSEPGSLFIGKDGDLVFKDRSVAVSSSAIILADNGSGIPYTGMKVVYGSELLYNEIVISSKITNGTATAIDSLSQGNYGIQNLTQTDLLMSTNAAVTELANWYSNKYANPEFRFESVEVIMNDLTSLQQNDILGLELGSVVKIVFTPGNPAIAPAIVKYAEIIRLDHQVDNIIHRVSIGFSTLDITFLVLNDPVFGMIDTASNVLGF
jgi:hypothetical protein